MIRQGESPNIEYPMSQAESSSGPGLARFKITKLCMDALTIPSSLYVAGSELTLRVKFESQASPDELASMLFLVDANTLEEVPGKVVEGWPCDNSCPTHGSTARNSNQGSSSSGNRRPRLHKLCFGNIVLDGTVPWGTFKLGVVIYRASDMEALASGESPEFYYIQVPEEPLPGWD